MNLKPFNNIQKLRVNNDVYPLSQHGILGKNANTAVVVEWRIARQYEYITAVDFKKFIFQPLLRLLKHVEEGSENGIKYNK